MAHEIHDNDGLVMANTGAWHGLGKVVEGAMNPFAALRMAGLDWEVLESDALTGIFNAGGSDEKRVSTDRSKMLVRSDDHSVLGVVGADFTPVQNATLAELAFALRAAGSDKGVEVETALSIKGGKRVGMLLRAPSVDMTGKGDEARPYLFLANGHDGTLALRVKPTSVRVVCANTFGAALADRGASWSHRHTQGITGRVEELATDIKRWFAAIEEGQETARALASRQMNRDAIRDLWADVLLRIDGPTPTTIKTKWDENRVEKATAFLAHAAQVFDSESTRYGANLWVAANAATNAIQHLRAGWSVRTKDAQTRAYAAWDGSTADATQEAFRAAMAMA
jgi:phage/plasmid-like protein (TIGR03299 family)